MHRISHLAPEENPIRRQRPSVYIRATQSAAPESAEEEESRGILPFWFAYGTILFHG
jgi:hypothetical protein